MGIVNPCVAADRELRVRFANDDGNVTTLWVVVRVSECPVSSATRNVGEAGTEVDIAGQIHTTNTSCASKGSAVRVGVVDAGVAIDQDAGIGWVDDDGNVTTLRGVVRISECPVSNATGDIGEAGTKVDIATEINTTDAGSVIQTCSMRIGVVNAGIAIDQDTGVSLGDGVAGRSIAGEVVGAASVVGGSRVLPGIDRGSSMDRTSCR